MIGCANPNRPTVPRALHCLVPLMAATALPRNSAQGIGVAAAAWWRWGGGAAVLQDGSSTRWNVAPQRCCGMVVDQFNVGIHLHELTEFIRTELVCTVACQHPQHEVRSDMGHSAFLILQKIDNFSKAPERVLIHTSHSKWVAFGN